MCKGAEQKWRCGCQARVMDHCPKNGTGATCEKNFTVTWMDSPCAKHEPNEYQRYTLNPGGYRAALPSEFSRSNKPRAAITPAYTSGQAFTLVSESLSSAASHSRYKVTAGPASPSSQRTIMSPTSPSYRTNTGTTARLVDVEPRSPTHRGTDSRSTIRATPQSPLGRVGDVLADSMRDLRLGGKSSSTLVSNRTRGRVETIQSTREAPSTSGLGRHGDGRESSRRDAPTPSRQGSIRQGPSRDTYCNSPGRSHY